MSDANSTSQLSSDEHRDESLLSPSVKDVLRTVLWEWEKLRLPYLAVVALAVLATTAAAGAFDLRWVEIIVEGAVVANVAYFAGPLAETYLRWLGYDRTWPRWALFAGGVALTCVLAFLVLTKELGPEH